MTATTAHIPTENEFRAAGARALEIIEAADSPAAVAAAVGVTVELLDGLARQLRADFEAGWDDLELDEHTFEACAIAHALLIGTLTGRELFG